MNRISAALLILLLVSQAQAQTSGTPEDHDALRKLMSDTLTAINAKDYLKAQSLMANPFRATVLTQDSFTNFNKLKDYFESLYTRDTLRMKTVRLNATADDLAQIYTGTYAVSSGATEEFYELADGRSFTLNGRWTAVTAKQDGQWKVVAVHTGVNPIENPILAAIEKATLWLAALTAGAGFLGGLVVAWLWRRFRRTAH
jgi:ketosteroid isomerase-like protein